LEAQFVRELGSSGKKKGKKPPQIHPFLFLVADSGRQQS